MKKLFLTLFAAFAVLSASAVPAINTPLTFTQSDGSSITVRLVGDEWFSTYITMDGYTLERSINGDFYYKTSLAVSNVMAHNQNARTQAELNYIAANANNMMLSGKAVAEQQAAGARKAPARKAGTQVPQKGSPNIPVILVSFSDYALRSSTPVATFEKQFNTNTKSALQYFTDQSNSQFTPKFDILGPVTLSKTRAYYGAKTSSANDAKPGSMAAEAVKALTNVDFSKYDNDGDGACDVVIILYAGPGEAQGATSNSIWPHQWNLSSAYYYGQSDYNSFTQNGVTINKYACFCETRGSSDYSTTIDGIGTFCHEFGHCLGLPDFYVTDYNHSQYCIGNWSIMNSGSYLNSSQTPAGYTAYEKEFMGWLTIPTAVANTQYTLNSLGSSNCNAVRIYNSADANEYYILENHPKTGWYAYQGGSGMLVNHVTYSASAWSGNTVNNNSSLLRMSIIPADNNMSSSSEAGDCYPYNGNNKLTNTSTPTAWLYNGTTKLMGKPITEITKNSDGTISFWYCKDFVKNVPVINNVPQSDIKLEEFTVSWNTVENTLTYGIEITDASGNTVASQTGLEVTTYKATDLKPNTTYTVKVNATYTDGTVSAWSAAKQVTTKSNPTMQATDETKVDKTSFTAKWNALDNVTSYTLHVRRMGLTNYEELLHETFDKCTKVATTNIASSINNYTDNAGWSGRYVYQNVSGVSLASTSSQGSITSPALDFSKYNGKVVVKIVAGTNGSLTDCSLIVSADGASQTITIPNSTQHEYTVVLMTGGNTGQSVTIAALPGKKVVVYDVQIFAGDADDVMASAPRKAATVTGDADEQFITGITSTEQLVENLMAGASYQYRVKAIYNNDCESGWSNVEQVDLLPAGLAGDVNADGSIDIADVNCIVAILLNMSAPTAYDGRDDVNGDGSTDVADINAVLQIILAATND